jgi:hypothetical protein
MKARERAKLDYDKEKARDKFSKLANSVGRPTMKAHTGQLVMLWRQKVKPGKVKGSWVGPVLVEGSTIWLATGSTLVRAKLSQLRPVTKREELQSTLEGTAIYRTPVTTETLMRAFQGRYYLDVSVNNNFNKIYLLPKFNYLPSLDNQDLMLGLFVKKMAGRRW